MEFQHDSEASTLLRSLLNSKTTTNLLQTSTLNPSICEKTVTLTNGKRITIKPKSGTTRKKETEFIENVMCAGSGNAKELIDMNKLYEKIRIQEKTESELKEFTTTNMELQEQSNELKKILNNKKKNMNSLWTEKYRPKKFIDLLGNENINSKILRWLNDWKHVKQKGKIVNSDSYNHDIFGDPFKRPVKKMLLIYGPPGIGKTTIVQCVCKQLGYEIQEINSSDERGGELVKEKVKNVLKMRNLKDKDICLMLDEIDGANGNENGFIRVLINLLNKDKKATDEWNSFNKLKYNKKEDFIKRPIVGVCNDINSNCLEFLKPHCEIIKFKNSNSKTIKKRLKMILKNEKTEDINESLIEDLIISMDGDIRNCINFLQFNSKDLTNGLKDGEINWFETIREMFNINRNDRRNKTEIFNDLLTKLNKSGDLNKINNGCFNIMLQIDHDDDELEGLRKIDSISESLYFHDLINLNFKNFEKEDINLFGSIVSMKFFQQFAKVGRNDVKYNFKNGENFEIKKRNEELIKIMMKKYKILNKRTLIDVISLINSIIIPNYKQTSRDFENNKIKVERVLEIMKWLGISIESVSGGYRHGRVYKLVPDLVVALIDQNCTIMKGKEQRIEEDVSNVNEIRAVGFLQVLEEKMKSEKMVTMGVKRLRTEPEEEPGRTAKVKTPVDLFRQQYNNFNKEERVMAASENRIWVKYHEGFSNAVRKELTWEGFVQ